VSLPIFLALLLAALLHAVWNALVRHDANRMAAATGVAAGGAVLGIVLIAVLASMSAAAAPYVVATSCIHVAYFALIARTYRDGELSVSYPIMRGLAPLFVTFAAAIFIEVPPPLAVTGIVVLAAGIVCLGVEGLRRGAGGLGAALANAVVIAAYTLVDGLGARLSEAPATYTAWTMIGGGIATVMAQMAWRGRGVVVSELRSRALVGLAGGAMSYAAYAIVLSAMTLTTIGAVAAVRESSVLFATAIGALALNERFGAFRWVAGIMVVAGLALLKLGGGS
jgi:drug/metabolite transporter (DMT)-like permease